MLLHWKGEATRPIQHVVTTDYSYTVQYRVYKIVF